MEIKKMFRKIKKQTHAVSPIVATLMLVLVSVGSAGAFYVWQSGWQGNIQVQTSSNDELNGEGYLTLGGSSTIYPVSIDAAEAFMEDHPQFKVEVKSGGSGSGQIAAAEGLIDIGASSSDPSETYFDTYPKAKAHLIGYDAVVPIINDGITDLDCVDAKTLTILYGVNGLGKTVWEMKTDGAISSLPTDWHSSLDYNTTTTINWSMVPTYPESTSFVTSVSGPVVVVDRSDISGTEECFCKKLVDSSDGDLDDTYASDHQLSLTGDNAKSGYGNPGVINEVGSTAGAIGFAALGLALEDDDVEVCYFSPAWGSDYTEEDFSGDTFTNDSLKGGIPDYSDISGGVSTQYRSLWYITDGEPTGLVKQFIDYVMWTENNLNFMHDNGYVSYFD